METAGQWPWKPASAKECVIAHQPNGMALKMDVTKIKCTYTVLSSDKTRRMVLKKSFFFLMVKQVGWITEVGLKLVVIHWWTGPVSRSWW